MGGLDWTWVGDHPTELVDLLIEHVQLTLIAVLIGLLISFPLGVLAYRHEVFHRRVTKITPYTVIVSITGVLYTIPSVALFAFLLPYTGLSTTTAEIGLVSYTLLILIRNIVAGLQAVPADVLEAANGMGYSGRQLLWRVELPLALPVIIAGVRVATVTIIGLVTVTALIGKGGFGSLILSGFRLLDPTQLVVGAVLSTVLAIVADALLVGAERIVTPWARSSTLRRVA
jgi:osmoprotectant transport system permease protein